MTETAENAPTLYLIPTPIGNLEDISLRALRILQSVDALACEDTRHTRKIYERHALTSPPIIFACHAHNEDRAVGRILSLLRDGKSVGLTSDAGAPGVSDPGQRAAAAVIEAGYEVIALPGPSAVITALNVSGLPAPAFSFLGFLPRRPGRQRKLFGAFAEAPTAIVFFESPFRVGKILKIAHEVLGDRSAAVCIELTKKFENIHRGQLADLAEQFFDQKIKGEVTIVIAPPSRDERGNDEDDSPFAML
ncbi:16S rRNA (cytidine(1402)-2'-O)-methyltransferase [Sneathiella sp. HT1-7]|uniref:16S rRNA (cytidine(1402)-2'-O)-methyltransferase n=1 Tax=Sneathiella sp. HT1-7 TaxID=2887192 RepID=UPI001D13A7DA|nr:16S rRNA (cytidine(1402)-2'-O)-methyltransferase [Sneathiella sp. HT1-7]MCC3306597.1 16S rRNA (cytidine(1402)-2'-O)-methyltransferase [Sneathiella sp. HT1-7]